MKRQYLWYTLAAVLLCVLLFYGYRPKTILQNDSAAIGRLRQLSESQTAYSAQHPERGFACSLADLSATGEYSGYRYLLRCETSPGGAAARYELVAQPLETGKTGARTYCVTEERLIWFNERGSTPDCLRAHKLVSRWEE